MNRNKTNISSHVYDNSENGTAELGSFELPNLTFNIVGQLDFECIVCNSVAGLTQWQ